MNSEIQYGIYIGCSDKNASSDIIKQEFLKQTIDEYLGSKKINYSIQYVEGGYKYLDETYVFEHTVYVTIIGDQSLDIVKLAKNLSSKMNQECFMVVKNDLKVEYR